MNKKEVFKLAKGFRGRAKNCIRIARERVEKALQYSYRDRRNKKRDMRGLWIQRINAGTRQHGVNYGNFIHGLMKENIQLNRKFFQSFQCTNHIASRPWSTSHALPSPETRQSHLPKRKGLRFSFNPFFHSLLLCWKSV
ncbi:uncharacterized protein Fot_09570 [Forsythia ovata]|uniref:50S ribosomal protein L20 n=1 Tax=Forsythia ovata TaxID=205694 RepID=A0ABD1WEE5_9LAMI